VLTVLRVVRLVDAAVVLAWLVLAIVSGGCLQKWPFPWAISNLEAAALKVL
jgi:hypothetical protein